ncbi:hypothetical protein ACLOJK_027490 [Asimina triloba]
MPSSPFYNLSNPLRAKVHPLYTYGPTVASYIVAGDEQETPPLKTRKIKQLEDELRRIKLVIDPTTELPTPRAGEGMIDLPVELPQPKITIQRDSGPTDCRLLRKISTPPYRNLNDDHQSTLPIEELKVNLYRNDIKIEISFLMNGQITTFQALVTKECEKEYLLAQLKAWKKDMSTTYKKKKPRETFTNATEVKVPPSSS